jgi:protein-S-isoprenylcysteine O-methyltransferase Ste14
MHLMSSNHSQPSSVSPTPTIERPALTVDPPASEGMFGLSLIGVGLALIFATCSSALGMSITMRAGVCMLIYAAPQLLHECRSTYRRLPSHLGQAMDRTVSIKLIAVYAVLLFVAIQFEVLAYFGSTRSKPAADLFFLMLPALIILAVPYTYLVHALQQKKCDEYFSVGCLFKGDIACVNWSDVRHFVLGWIIKLFFFPLMLWELTRAIRAIDMTVGNPSGAIHDWYRILVADIYFVDVCIAATGYLATLRLFGWQIRSCSPYPIAWLVTLVCYYPFFGYLYRSLLSYNDDGYNWHLWLADYPTLLVLWGGAILSLKLVWIWSITAFGLRFSNLTNRGIITDGAYRFSKHPSYISKNLFWWLIAVPFVSPSGVSFAIVNSLQLAAVGVIYLLRARYEELHLSEEPRYVAYALWIEKHGIFRWLGYLAPVLRYKPPRTASLEGLSLRRIDTASTKVNAGTIG